MKDFCSMPERDYIRLIAAQDLRESGIDVADMSVSMSQQQFANVTNSHHYHTYHHHHTTYSSRGTGSASMTTPSKNLHNSSLNAAKYHTNTMDYHHHSHHHHDSSTKPRPTFGVELKKIECITVTVNEQQLSVPTFLKNALEHIEHKFLLNEGIFRKSGTAQQKDIRAQIEQGNYNFTSYQNMGDMTSVVKSFIREIPGSLLTFPLYSSFIQAAKLEPTGKTRLDALLNLCLQLPDAHLHLLIYLMNFLHQVTMHDSVNKMNAFNLATIFAPNIIYNPDPQSNAYLNEERMVTQTLIENSSMIGRISDSVYERSQMLTELCNSTAAKENSGASGMVSINSGAGGGAVGGNGCISDYNYDSDFPDNTSFAHHAQSIGSTSLSSYSTTSSKKDKKKRRSSSLKELMNTIQNSISSKFRRRSASEKNDKTTCSIITAGLNDASTTNIGDVTTCSNSRFMSASSSHHHHHHHHYHQDSTPFIYGNSGTSSRQIVMMTPLCGATPRINKRNAEESLQSTTKKKLIEKLPQRNLLLPDAPKTPFSTSKKSKYQFKLQIDNQSGKDGNKTDVGNGKPPISTNIGSLSMAATPQTQKQPQTPATLTAANSNKDSTSGNNLTTTSTAGSNLGLHKQLKYEESPSLANHTTDLVSFKPKYGSLMMDPSKRINVNNVTCGSSSKSGSSNGCCHRHHHHHNHHHSSSSSHHHTHASSNCSGTSSSHRSSHTKHKHHHASSSHHPTSHHMGLFPGPTSSHHHHHHKESSSSSSSRHHNCAHSSHHHKSSKQHHYVNAIPFSPSKTHQSSKSTGTTSTRRTTTKYTELSTHIIHGNIKIPNNTTHAECHSSPSSSSSSSLLNSSRSTVSSSPTASEASIASSSRSSVCSKKKNQSMTTKPSSGANDTASNFHTTGIERSVIGDSSMRCTLRRGRPNTPKTGLSGADYRTRKSSVPNTPEAKHFIQLRANNTISNTDDILQRIENRVAQARKKDKSKVELGSTCSLNTAIIQTNNAPVVSAEEEKAIKSSEAGGGEEEEIEGSSDARLLDMAFNEDDLTDTEENGDEAEEGMCNERIENESVTSSCVSSPSKRTAQEANINPPVSNHHRHISLSMSNIPDNLSGKEAGGSVEEYGHSEDNNSTVSSSESMGGNRTSVSESVVLGMTTFGGQGNSYLAAGGVKKSLADFSGSIDKLGESCMARVKDQSTCFQMQDQTDMSTRQMETTSCDNESTSEIKNPYIEEQQKLIKFEPFNEFKMPQDMPMHHTPFIKLPNETDSTSGVGQFVLDRRESALDDSQDSARLIDNAALNETLRRQSLFQLKDSLIGKVSRQVNEIEKRKKSPKNKEKAESSGSEGTSSVNTSVTKRYVSPVRIPSIFGKKTASLEAPPQDQYVINTKSKYISENKLSKTIATCLAEKRKKSVLGNRTNESSTSSSSPLIVKAAAQFCRRHMNRNRSVKRLNSTSLSSYHARSNLSAISESSHTPSRHSNQDSSSDLLSDAKSTPTTSASPSLLLSNKLKCTSESIDL